MLGGCNGAEQIRKEMKQTEQVPMTFLCGICDFDFTCIQSLLQREMNVPSEARHV
jgi:hypothetical protein